jgi:hypothetical protein
VPTGGAAPDAKYVVDGRGKFVVPGLFLAGAGISSFSDVEAGRLLATGVTSVAVSDPAATEVARWQGRLDRGQFYGPRLVSGHSAREPDTRPGASNVQDVLERLISVERLAAAGALRVLTLDAAGRAGLASTLGSIDEGKIADMILLSGDPLADAAHLRRIDLLVFRGEVLTRAHLNLLEQGKLKPGDGPLAARAR